MRIISQNGMIDIPYEMTAIHAGETFIRMNMTGDTGKGTVMATYSTQEKAERAMEMLHDKYESRMELDGGYDVLHDCYVQPNFWVLPKVFRFPQEDEL